MIPMGSCRRIEGYSQVIDHLHLQVTDWDLGFDVYYSNINQIRIDFRIEGALFCTLEIMGSCPRISHITKPIIC